jgi:hypothetical protein
MLAMMIIKRRTALKGFAKLFKKLVSGKISETSTVDKDRFTSVDDVK